MQIKWKAFDIENDSSNWLGRKAGHFLYDPIVSMAYYDGKQTRSEYVFNDFIKQSDFLDELLKDCNLIVGHNLKHDLLFFWKDKALQNWFKAGGRIWDTQYAEYRIQGQLIKLSELGLRSIAPKFYNISERSKNLEDLLFDKLEPNEYTQVSQLPKGKVLEDNRNDVEDTGKIFIQQFQKTKDLGMFNAVWLLMDSILAMCEIEYNGMHYNLSTLEKGRLKLETELQVEYDKLNTLIKDIWK